jgi:hypothetical protein
MITYMVSSSANILVDGRQQQQVPSSIHGAWHQLPCVGEGDASKKVAGPNVGAKMKEGISRGGDMM